MAENRANPEAPAMGTSDSVRAHFVTETFGGVNYQSFKEAISGSEKTIQSSKVGAPFAAQVELANPGIRDDYLARHPEKTGDQVPTYSWHFVAVRGMDENGAVQIYNPYGINRTWSLQELYNVMGKPGE